MSKLKILLLEDNEADALLIVEELKKSHNLKLVGIHFHIGSQIPDIKTIKDFIFRSTISLV